MNSKYAVAAVCVAMLMFAPGGSRVAYAAPPTDACALLTSAQVSAALGVPVSTNMHLNGNNRLCTWPRPISLPPPKSVIANIADVHVFPFEHRPTFYPGEVRTKAKGIGDDAFYDTVPESGLGTRLTVKKANFAFSLTVHGFPLEQTKAKEKTLALEVLAKL